MKKKEVPSLAKKLKKLRDELHLTQKEVADQLGISQSYISRLEKRIIERLKREMLRMM